jgi:hypothetical protein
MPMKFIVVTMSDTYNGGGSIAPYMVWCGPYRISTIKLQYLSRKAEFSEFDTQGRLPKLAQIMLFNPLE